MLDKPIRISAATTDVLILLIQDLAPVIGLDEAQRLVDILNNANVKENCESEALRSERSQGDLISRSALKNYWENRILTDCSYISSEEILQSIDDASAVEPDSLKGECCGSCYLCDVSDCGADTIKEGKNET